MTPVMPPGPPRHRLGGYREYAPPPHLQRFVESLWSHRAPDQLPTGPGAMIIGPKHRPHIFAFQPARVPAWTDKEHDEDWDYIVRTVIERAWRGVRGQG